MQQPKNDRRRKESKSLAFNKNIINTMTFSFSFAGVQVSISPSSPSSDNKGNFEISSVRHCDDGHMEADVCNFTGTITISEESSSSSCATQPEDYNPSREVVDVVVNAIPEKAERCQKKQQSIISEETSPSSAEQHEHYGSSRDVAEVVVNANNAIRIKAETHEEKQQQDQHQIQPQPQPQATTAGENILDNIEYDKHKMEHEEERSLSTADSSNSPLEEEAPKPFICPIPHHESHITVEIDSDDDEKREAHNNSPKKSNGKVSFALLSNSQIMVQEADYQSSQEAPDLDLRLHKACASEESQINDLRNILTSNPHLASIPDEFGDYPAHIFANNDAFIYTSSSEDREVQQFVFELYTACPAAFLTEGYSGRIPFAEAIVDWVDDCHQVYQSSRNSSSISSRGGYGSDVSEVVRVSEIQALTKSTRVINSLCVREEVQRLVQLPSHVSLPVKVFYSFQMLSFLLDTLSENSFDEISTRREFWVVASKRRDGIIESVASLPFLVRTILLVECKNERNALLDLSIVRNLMFRPESVDLWLVALLSGGERARACATEYLCIVSRASLSGLFGRKAVRWNEHDIRRFQYERHRLYGTIGKLTGFLPCMLHLGDSLYEVGTKQAVTYIVESTVGRPLPVYKKFMEMFLLLVLMTSYRIVVELVYAIPEEEFLRRYQEFWVLALSIAVYFGIHDVAILFSLAFTEERLVMRYACSFRNMIGYVTCASVIAVLSMLHIKGNVEGRNYVGIVSGLLWWKFLLHVKGMSQNLSTMIYTIMQIAATLKYFMVIFLIGIFFFADMIDIVKKTSGECDNVDGDMDLEAFCSLTPLQSYLAMYGVMIGGMEISSLEGSSPLVSVLFVAASFCGVIVLVNILIAIVTREYEKAQERSCIWFARARLEAAAEQVAIEKVWNPPDDPNSGIARKIWRMFAKAKHAAFLIVVEVFLIKSLLSCESLNKDGILGDFLYVALILCAILYHFFCRGGDFIHFRQAHLQIPRVSMAAGLQIPYRNAQNMPDACVQVHFEFGLRQRRIVRTRC